MFNVLILLQKRPEGCLSLSWQRNIVSADQRYSGWRNNLLHNDRQFGAHPGQSYGQVPFLIFAVHLALTAAFLNKWVCGPELWYL